MLLYQGAVNKGRGVDWAIDALEWLEDCRLVVAGGGDLLEEMKAYAAKKPWAERIAFVGRLMPEELEGLTRKADVGLVMLEDMGLSYHFALPNRIGDFVAAGVPMVVSDLPEMSRVVREFGVGEVIESGKWKVESGKWKVESGERRVESGERRVESGEWGVESGEWRVESGEWRAESGEWRVESACAGGGREEGAGEGMDGKRLRGGTQGYGLEQREREAAGDSGEVFEN